MHRVSDDDHRRVSKTALVVAHPGHELRLATWVTRTKPVLYIVTKGARAGTSQARIQASRALAEELGATPSDLFGIALDAEIYDWIMSEDVRAFSRVADQLRDDFVERGIDRVVTDGWQNYNPVHDLTHALARTAGAEASVVSRRRVEALDYPVVMGHLAHADPGPEHSRIDLSPEDLKVKAGLIDRYPDIAEDVDALSEAVGLRAFDTEVLHDLLPLARLMCALGETPWYERHGEGRVRAGVYSSVLRWSHMAPIVTMLAERLARAESHWTHDQTTTGSPYRNSTPA